MKALFIALACLSVSSAFAYTPKVGDTVTYEGTVTFLSSGASHKTTTTGTVTAIDETAQTLTVDVTEYSALGETQKYQQTMAMDSFAMLPSNVQETKDLCDMIGGTYGKVTVKAGEFDACTIDAIGASIGAVPFGTLKSSETNEVTKVEMELSSFAFGQ